MDDPEKMRETLATKCMGWEWYVNPYNGSEWWVLPDGTAMLASNWAPWESWEQAGLVIEAMREKGWQWEIEDGYENGFVRVTLTGAMGNGPDVFDEDERYARMLAAYRALEASDA